MRTNKNNNITWNRRINGVRAAKPSKDSKGLVEFELGISDNDWDALEERLKLENVLTEK